jgi:hypothetical protein
MGRKLESNKSRNEATITGIVTASEWDDDDNIIAVAISTEDEDYIVELNKLGAELFDFLDDYVEVTGFVNKDANDGIRIRVIDYEVLADNEYDGEYDDYAYCEDEEVLGDDQMT